MPRRTEYASSLVKHLMRQVGGQFYLNHMPKNWVEESDFLNDNYVISRVKTKMFMLVPRAVGPGTGSVQDVEQLLS